MKTIITLLVAFTISFSTIAQNHYIDSTSVWKETYGWFLSGYNHFEYYKNVITGDTVINSNTYYKIQQIGIDSVFNMSSFVQIDTINQYRGAIREDTINNKIYVASSPETLLYDFSLNIGDTIPQMEFFQGCSTQPVLVSCIDTVIFSGQARRRIYIGTTSFYIIEGIGSPAGLFGGLCPTLDAGGCLITYYKNSDSLFVNGCVINTNPCFATTIDNNIETEIIFSVSPNPATNQIEIKGNDILSLTLCDVLGRVVFSNSEVITPLTINTTSFSRGIYFLQARTKNGTVARKVVLQ